MKGTRVLTIEKGKKLALLSLGALLVISGVTWFYDYNQWTINQEHQARIGALSEKIADTRQLARTMTQTATIRAQLQQFVNAHEATMVSGDQFAWVIHEISQLAESQPVGNVSTQPGSVIQHARNAAHQWYVTHLEFAGDYDQIGKFIQELENHFPEAEIRSLAIVATETPAIHRATLDLALLVRPASESDNVLLAQKTGPNHESTN